jgi:hypothetical protein
LWRFINWLNYFLGRRGGIVPPIVVVGARQAGPAARANSLIDVTFYQSSAHDRYLGGDKKSVQSRLRALQ